MGKYQLFFVFLFHTITIKLILAVDFISGIDKRYKDTITDYQSDDYQNYNNVKEEMVVLREYIEKISIAFQQLELDTQNKLEIQATQYKKDKLELEEELTLTKKNLQKQIDFNNKSCLDNLNTNRIAIELELTTTKIKFDNDLKQLKYIFEQQQNNSESYINNRLNNLDKGQNQTKLTIEELINNRIVNIETNLDDFNDKQKTTEQDFTTQLNLLLRNQNVSKLELRKELQNINIELSSNFENKTEEINNKLTAFNETFKKEQIRNLMNDENIEIKLNFFDEKQNYSERTLLQNISNNLQNFVSISEFKGFDKNISTRLTNLTEEIIKIKSKFQMVESKIKFPEVNQSMTITNSQNTSVNNITNRQLSYSNITHVRLTLPSCGEFITAYPNAIVKYPASGQYANHLDCIWKVERPPGVVFVVQTLSMDIADDTIWLFASGLYTPSWRRQTLHSLIARSNKFDLRFKTDISVVGNGFVIKWTAVKLEDICKGNRFERSQSGGAGITKTECERLGFCWDATYSDAYNCYYQQELLAS